MSLEILKKIIALTMVFALALTGSAYGGCGCQYDDNGYEDDYVESSADEAADDGDGMVEDTMDVVDEAVDVVEEAVDVVDDALFGEDGE